MNDLRWFRWLQIGLGVFALLTGALTWATGGELWWLVAGSGVLLLVGAAAFEPAIRRGPPSPADRAEMLRRGQRVSIAILGVTAGIAAVVITILDSVVAALFTVAIMAVGGALGLWLTTRLR